MTAKRAPKKAAPVEPTADQVAAYLLAHPDFFERHSEMLLELRVPHPTGDAISLIERQVEHLRDEVHQSRKKLVHLVSLAKDNDALASRLHRLTLSLVLGKDFDQLQAALEVHLHDEFGADAVRLILFPAERLRSRSSADGTQTGEPDPVVGEFLGFLETQRPVCGTLRPEQLATLFPEQTDSVRSAALIPLDAGDVLGILAIGSTNAERFRPAMATDFLLRLGEFLGHKLRTVPLPGV